MSTLPVLPEVGDPISAEQVEAIERKASAYLSSVSNVHALKEFLAQARALEAYLRDRGLQGPMLGTQRRTEGRIGQLLGEPHHGVHKHTYELIPHDVDRLDFRLLARALEGECDPPLTDEEWRKSRRALIAVVRYRLGLQPITPAFPEGTYQCIVADPPWQLSSGPDTFRTKERGNQPLPYAPMTVEAICALEVERLAAPAAHLYLWTTNRYLETAYGVARAWGFQPSTVLVWCKTPRGIGLGDTFRQTTEFVLFARRGSLTARRIVDRTWFEWPRGKHSVKPAAFYDLVESVTPPPYLDLFARRARPNWTVWGAEAPGELAVAR